MIIIPNGNLSFVKLDDGRAVYLDQAELDAAYAEAKRSPRTMTAILEGLASEQEGHELEALKRLKATRLAIEGKWSELRRQLDLWGVEPLR